jgi:hypothetical protein
MLGYNLVDSLDLIQKKRVKQRQSIEKYNKEPGKVSREQQDKLIFILRKLSNQMEESNYLASVNNDQIPFIFAQDESS